MYNLQDVRNYVDSIKNNTVTPTEQIINSLQKIRNELATIQNIKNPHARSALADLQSTKWIVDHGLVSEDQHSHETYKRKIKSQIEYNIYCYLKKYHLNNMPEVIKLTEQYVIMPKYHFKKTMSKDDIILIIKTLHNFSLMGISHRAINPYHIMYSSDNQPVIIDYGKSCFLGTKSNFYSQRPIYASRNTLLQNPSEELDDLESFGYVLLDLKMHKTLDTFISKDDFVYNYQNIDNIYLQKYFKLIKERNTNYKKYIIIFLN